MKMGRRHATREHYFLFDFMNLNAHVIYEPCIPHDWEIFRKQLQPGPLNIYIYIYAIYTFLGRVLAIETDDASEARERMAKKKGKKLVGAVKPSVDMGRHDVDPRKKKVAGPRKMPGKLHMQLWILMVRSLETPNFNWSLLKTSGPLLILRFFQPQPCPLHSVRIPSC